MFIGYGAAKDIDHLISELIEAHGITTDTSNEWATFVRTIRTSLDLIDGELMKLPKVCPQCGGKGKIQ